MAWTRALLCVVDVESPLGAVRRRSSCRELQSLGRQARLVRTVDVDPWHMRVRVSAQSFSCVELSTPQCQFTAHAGCVPGMLRLHPPA